MATKVWQAEDVRNHLLAVQTGVRASTPVSLILDGDGCLAAYCQGSDAAVKYLAERFGIDLDDTKPARKTQTGELRLKTWARQDIEQNLKVAWTVMYNEIPLSQEQNVRLAAYYKGIKKVLFFLALSFGLEGFALSRNGSSAESSFLDQA